MQRTFKFLNFAISEDWEDTMSKRKNIHIQYVRCSVPDPWHFGVDPDPDSDQDPAIFVIDLKDGNKKLIF